MSDNLRDLLNKAVGDQQRPDRSPGKPQKGDRTPRIVSPDDERGTPYPGDFPNPLDGKTPGCF